MKYVVVKGRLICSTHIERLLTIKLQFLTVYIETNLNSGQISYIMSVWTGEQSSDLYLIEKEQYEELFERLLALNTK